MAQRTQVQIPGSGRIVDRSRLVNISSHGRLLRHAFTRHLALFTRRLPESSGVGESQRTIFELGHIAGRPHMLKARHFHLSIDGNVAACKIHARAF